MIPAIIQTAVLIIGLIYCRRFPMFLLALAAALPPLWLPAGAGIFETHADWERGLWLPCAFLLIPAQAIASLEACFKFGERYWFSPTITATLSALGGAIATSVLLAMNGNVLHGSLIAQIMQVARYQRIACCVLLVAIVTLYAILRPKGLIARVDGAHLILVMLLAVVGAVVSLRALAGQNPQTWTVWLQTTWMTTARTALYVLWVLLVALRRPRLQLAYARHK